MTTILQSLLPVPYLIPLRIIFLRVQFSVDQMFSKLVKELRTKAQIEQWFKQKDL